MIHEIIFYRCMWTFECRMYTSPFPLSIFGRKDHFDVNGCIAELTENSIKIDWLECSVSWIANLIACYIRYTLANDAKQWWANDQMIDSNWFVNSSNVGINCVCELIEVMDVNECKILMVLQLNLLRWHIWPFEIVHQIKLHVTLNLIGLNPSKICARAHILQPMMCSVIVCGRLY